MKARNATELRVTRRGTVGPCKCKVGPCRKCGSKCKRCKCQCDGYSILETLNRLRSSKEKSSQSRRKTKAPKRLKASDKLIKEPVRSSKRDKAKRSWAHLNDDDSTYLASLGTNNNDENQSEDKRRRASKTIVVLRTLMDTDNIKTAVEELSKTISSISLPATKQTLKKLLKSAMDTNSIEYSDSSETTIRNLLDILHLPYESSNDLQQLLSSTLTKRKNVNQYETRNASRNTSKGKQITSLSNLRQQFIKLTQKCEHTEDVQKRNSTPVVLEPTTTEICDYDSTTLTDTQNDTVLASVELAGIDIEADSVNNHEKLTDQVLTLPRQYRPINLRNDRILQTDNSVTENISVSTIIVPQLPGIPDNIRCEQPKRAQTKRPKKVNKISQMIDLLDIPSYLKKELPSQQLREKSDNLERDNKNKYRRLVSMGYKMITNVVDTLCPGPSRSHLFTDICLQLSKQADHLLDDDQRMIKSKYNKLVSALCSCMKVAKKDTVEKKVCRAILYKGTSHNELGNLMKQHNFTFAAGKARISAAKDFASLQKGELLKKKKMSFAIISDEVLETAVKFILSENNVVAMSYGSRFVKLAKNEIIQLPSLTRKKTRLQMYQDYISFVGEDSKLVSRATMYKLMNHLTSNDEAILTAIDYVTAILVNEPCEMLQDIIEQTICSTKQTELTRKLYSARHFLKHTYKSHAVLEDTVCYHNLQYGLGRTLGDRDCNNCASCKFPFYVCSRIEQLVDDPSNTCVDDTQREDAKRIVRDVAEKFALYMAHSMRCTNQSTAIKKLHSEIQNECLSSKGVKTRAILIVDFKMKFEAKSARETTVEHFGKRGIGWHGGALIYYMYQQKQDDDGNLMVDDNGKEVMIAKKHIIYIDQILEDGNKQDGLVVISLIESAITAIHEQLPFINSIIIQSDNANQYQNAYLILGIHLINMNMRGKIFISEFIHSETQDGKTILDAHFATTNRHLMVFMKIWRDNRITRVQTPAGLAFALSFNAGIRNTMVQLIEPNRSVLEKIESELTQIVKVMKGYFTRANHIFYTAPDDEQVFQTKDMIANIKTLRFRVALQSFSYIDEPLMFQIDIAENTFTPLDETNNETETVHEIIPDYNWPDNSNQQSSINSSTNDFSFHGRRIRLSQSINMQKTISELEHFASDEMNDTNIDNDTSDDESYNEDDSSDTSEEDDDNILKGAVNVKDAGLRQYGAPKSEDYHVDKMITAVKIIYQQELGTVKCLALRKGKARNLIVPTSQKVQFLRQDSVAKGVRLGKDIINSSNYFIDTAKNDPMHEIATEYVPNNDHMFNSSWARRKGHGKMYGMKYIKMYQKDLEAMFEEGNKDSSKKMNPGKMREHLIRKYPNNFSIPGETEIKQFIGSQLQKAKYHQKKQQTESNSGEKRGRKPGPKQVWKTLLEPFVIARHTIKNAVLFDEFIKSLGPIEQWPNDLPRDVDNNEDADKKKVTAAIGNIKQKLKKDRKRSLLA